MGNLFIAFTTKGLEHVTVREIRSKLPQASVRSVLTKRVVFSAEVKPKKLLKLRTADDVHLLVGTFDAEEPSEELVVKRLPLNGIGAAKAFVARFRKLNETFSLTVSKYKNTAINADALALKLSELLEKSLDMKYTPRDHANFDIRVYIEGSTVTFSCKLPRASLYNRAYRVCGRKGALKPTIAAALCLLVSPARGKKIVDNFCGTGTILCEAFLQDLDPYGGDVVPEMVDCACENIKFLSAEHMKRVKVLDAISTKWPDSYFDYAVSNLPWGQQVDLKNVTRLYSSAIAEYARILKPNGSVVLLGIKPDLLVKHLKKNFPRHEIVKFRIGFLGQNPWVVCALASF